MLSLQTCGRKTAVTGYLSFILLSFHFSSAFTLSMARHRFPSQQQQHQNQQRRQQLTHLYPHEARQQLESPSLREENEYQTQPQDPQLRSEEVWDTSSSSNSLRSKGTSMSQQQPAAESLESGSYAVGEHPIILMRRGRSVQVCGDTLVDTLSLICGGKYNRPDKRTISFVLLGKRPLMSGSDLKSGGEGTAESIFLRNVRGVADECCLNSCSMSQIRSYCE